MPSQKQSMMMGALVTALLGILFGFFTQSASPNPVMGVLACCLPGLLGPLVAVWHNVNNNNLTMASGEGAKLGAMAAALGSVISTIVGLLFRAMGVWPSMAEMVERQRDAMIQQGMPDAQIDQAMKFTEMFMGTWGQLIGGVIGVVVMALIGAIGGLIGAAIFKKGKAEG